MDAFRLRQQLDGTWVTTTATWFGPEDRPLAGFLTVPEGAASGVVVVAPAVGYEYWSTHRTMRAAAERLAAAGHVCLRFDYDGTGDSSGDQWEEGRLRAWRGSLEEAVRHAKEFVDGPVTLVGVRLGGLLEILDGGALGAVAVAGWEPVLSGRRYARELTLLGEPLPPASSDDPSADAGVVHAGFVLRRETLDEVRALPAIGSGSPTVPQVLLLSDEPASLADAVSALESRGSTVELVRVGDGRQALERPAEEAVVAEDVVEALTAWGRSQTAGRAARRVDAPDMGPATMPWRAGQVTEQLVAVTGAGLAAVRSCPVGGGSPAGPVVVLLNPGSEPHVGSGRAWVEMARDLALAGRTTLRLDFSGWGESPALGHSPGRPYDRHTVDETVEVVRALAAEGCEAVLVGLCAGAWTALEAARATDAVTAVVAINPQLYWEPGDPVEALITDTHRRREAERARYRDGARWGVWSLLDRLGLRPRAGRLLRELQERTLPVLAVFAIGDDGLEYLRDRVGRRWAAAQRYGRVRLLELDIDHSLHRAWQRPALTDAVRSFLDELALPAPAPAGPTGSAGAPTGAPDAGS